MATSCLTYFEVEEAFYRLLVQSAKGVSHAEAIDLFNISELDLTSATVRLQLQQLDLQTAVVPLVQKCYRHTAGGVGQIEAGSFVILIP